MGTGKNRLANEVSPYLVQHAQNPVDWYPWGPEALERAKSEDRPILLSIGYSACHWCHVMERESFENEAIARQMNQLFVNIKVDREERPDLDQVYQLVVQLMGRSGGWPLTVFLTPEQKPFFAGTYFPPEDRHGMPGFPKILSAVAEAYRERREDVTLQADELTQAIAKVTSVDAGTYVAAGELLARAVEKLGARFDDRHGGFGQRPKFPNTMGLDILLRHGDVESRARVATALDGMRNGGIHDHLGGGFHRYSTDEKWLVPHFEKMLYDNALLLRLYVDAARALEAPRYLETAGDIVRYVAREMTDAGGGFYSSQDADSEGEEGKFFVWSPDEVNAALASESEETRRLTLSHFAITTEGNFEESGKTVLSTPGDARLAPEVLARVRQRLLEVRQTRIKPFRDEKILAGWNGLMIGALVEYAAVSGDAEAMKLAERAFDFLRRTLITAEGRVLRHIKGETVKGPGFLDDHAYLANAALDLHEATGQPDYLASARAIGDAMLTAFADREGGGFFFTPADGEALIHRAKDPYDQAIPSGEAMACLALLRLGTLVDAQYAVHATSHVERMAGAAMANPLGMGQMVCVADRLLRGSVDIVLVGPDARSLAREVFAAYIPNRSVSWSDPSKTEPGAYVCRGRTCSLPVQTPEALRALLFQDPIALR
jgi:uncharacterized protein YyaL (SSP411 family)